MKSSTVKRIIVVLCFIFAIGLITMLVLNGVKDFRKEKQLEKVKKEAFPLEQELRQAQKELDELEDTTNIRNSVAQVMVGYQIGEEEDFRTIEKQLKEFSIHPYIVIDVNQEKFDQLVKLSQEKKYPIILTATPIDNENLKSITRTSQKYSIYNFLLRNVDDNKEILESLSSIGFKVCIRYLDLTDNQVLDNGMVCTNYSLIKSGNFSIGSRLNQLITSKQSLMFVFDLDGGRLSGDAIAYDLNCIEDWVKQGEVEYVSLDDAVTSIKKNQNQTAKKQNESSENIAQLRTKIEELQSEIDEIYSHWNGD